MRSLSELIVKIGSDTTGLSDGLKKLNFELSRSVDQANATVRGFQKFGSTLTDIGGRLSLGISLPLTAIAGASVKASADMDSLRAGLVAVTGSGEAAGAQFERLRDVAKLPGLGMREAVQGAVNLQAAGLSAETAERALKAFGNALATVGKGKDDLQGVILALGQIQSKGKISAEEINQLAERVPQIRRAMQAAFGTADTEAIQKMGITAQEFIGRIITEFDKLPPVTGGIKNQLENVRDSIDETLAQIGKAFQPATAAALNYLQPVLDKVKELAGQFAGLPEPVRAAAGAIVGFAAVLPGALLAIGQMSLGISGIVQILPLLKAGFITAAAGISVGFLGIVSKVPAAITAASSALGALTMSIPAFVTGIAAAAGAMLYLAIKFREAQLAEEELAKAESTRRAALDRLVKHLRENGAAVDHLTEAYRAGKLSFDDYERALQRLGIAHAKARQAARDHAAGVTVSAEQLKQAYSTLNLKSVADQKAELDKARQAVEQIARAYKSGTASAQDLTNAKAALKRMADESVNSFKRAAEAVGGLQTKLEEAYKTLQIRSSSSRQDELIKAGTAVERIRAAYVAGKAAAIDYINAIAAFGNITREQSSIQVDQVERARQALQEATGAYAAGKISSLDLAEAQAALSAAAADVAMALKSQPPELHSAAGAMANTATRARQIQEILAGWRREIDQAAITKLAIQLQDSNRYLTEGGQVAERFTFNTAQIGPALSIMTAAELAADRQTQALIDSLNAAGVATGRLWNLFLQTSPMAKLADDAKRYSDALSVLQIDPSKFGPSVSELEKARDIVIQTTEDYETRIRAELKILEARQAAGQLSRQEEQTILRYRRYLGQLRTDTLSTDRALRDALTRIAYGFRAISDNLVDLAFKGGKFKDMMVDATKGIARSLAALAIERTLAAIGKQVFNLITQIPVLGKLGSAIGAALGIGSGAAQAAGGIAGAAGSIGGAGSAAAGTAMSGAMGAIGVVAGAVSAVSGIIGNFQSARQETSLNAIEWNTRKSSLHLEDILNKINAGIPGFGGVQDRIMQVYDLLFTWNDAVLELKKVSIAGGGVTINMEGTNFIGFRDLDAFLDEIVRRLKQRGV